MYLVAPLGLSKEATNPWVPGSYIDPLVFLAWMLVLFGPCLAGGIAYQRHKKTKGPPPPKRDLARQAMTAALLTNLVGALFATVLGTGTVALMINASWLRNWLYHGRQLLFGVAGLQPVLRGNTGAISYSHEITAVSDSGVFIAICLGFLVIGIAATGFVAMCALIDSPEEPGGPRRDDGGPPDFESPPEPPGGSQVPHITEDAEVYDTRATATYATALTWSTSLSTATGCSTYPDCEPFPIWPSESLPQAQTPRWRAGRQTVR